MELTSTKARIGEDPFVFGESIGVAVSGGGEHGQGKTSGRWRRYATGIRDELQSDCPATRSECRMRFSSQLLAGRQVEMMEEVREQDNVVRTAPIGVEGTARFQGVAIGDARLLRILSRNRQNARPIECSDSCFRIVLSDGNAKQAMSSSDIQHSERLLTVAAHQACQ